MITSKSGTDTIVKKAWGKGIVIPGFNIPYLPMMEPVVRALHDTGTFGLIMVARLEWMKFKSGSMNSIRDEYEKLKDLDFTRLHLDHVPVIDEDNLPTDFENIIAEAIGLGYDSVMIDGSRLSLEENIEKTHKIVELAHEAGIPVEAELGAEARKEVSETLKKLGYNSLMMNKNLTRFGAVESPEEGRKYARFIADNYGKFDGVILCLTNFGDQSMLTGAPLQNSWSTDHQRVLHWLQEAEKTGKP